MAQRVSTTFRHGLTEWHEMTVAGGLLCLCRSQVTEIESKLCAFSQKFLRPATWREVSVWEQLVYTTHISHVTEGWLTADIESAQHCLMLLSESSQSEMFCFTHGNDLLHLRYVISC